MLAPIAWRTPPRALRPVGAGHQPDHRGAGRARHRRDPVRHRRFGDVGRTGRASAPCRTRRTRTMDGRVWEALHVAHALSRSGEFDLVHNNLDWLPLSFSAAVRGADGHHHSRLLQPRRSCPPTGRRVGRTIGLRVDLRFGPGRRSWTTRPPSITGSTLPRCRSRRTAARIWSSSAASTRTRAPPRRSRSPGWPAADC